MEPLPVTPTTGHEGTSHPQSVPPGSDSPPPVATSLDHRETSVKLPPPPCLSYNAPPLTPDQTFIHSGWAHLRNRIRNSLVRTSQTSARIKAFDECCNDVRVYHNIDDPTETHTACNACHDRLCTPCANKRSRIIRDCLMTQMEGKRIKFITLTLAGNNPDLTALVDKLYRSFRALRLHPLWEECVRGGAAFLEVKWSELNKRWHPHLHIFVEAKFIPQGRLSTAWHSITGDSYIVDVSAVETDDHAAKYVTKYASKPLHMSFARDPELLDRAVVALKGRRLCLTFGTWYGTPLTQAEDTDETTAWWFKDPYQRVEVGHIAGIYMKAQRGDPDAAFFLRKSKLIIARDATKPP